MSREYEDTKTLGRESWKGQMGVARTPAVWQTNPASRAGLGVSVHHCMLLLVCSRQTGHLSGCSFPISAVPTQYRSAERWGWSPDGKLLCSLGAEGFLGSVRRWSCLEGGSLTRARRPELVRIPAGGFPGPGNRWRVSVPWAAPLLHLHIGFLPNISSVLNTISFSA